MKNFHHFFHTNALWRGTLLFVVVAVVLTRPEQSYDGRCWESIFRFKRAGKPKRVTAPGRHALTKPPFAGEYVAGMSQDVPFLLPIYSVPQGKNGITQSDPRKFLRTAFSFSLRRIRRTSRASYPGAQCADRPRRFPSLRARAARWDFLRANGRRIRRSPSEEDRARRP